MLAKSAKRRSFLSIVFCHATDSVFLKNIFPSDCLWFPDKWRISVRGSRGLDRRHLFCRRRNMRTGYSRGSGNGLYLYLYLICVCLPSLRDKSHKVYLLNDNILVKNDLLYETLVKICFFTIYFSCVLYSSP